MIAQNSRWLYFIINKEPEVRRRLAQLAEQRPRYRGWVLAGSESRPGSSAACHSPSHPVSCLSSADLSIEEQKNNKEPEVKLILTGNGVRGPRVRPAELAL